MKASDPNFSEQLFYGRVNEMFLAVQKAWEARNMEPARRFLSQQQFDVLQGGVGEYVRNGQINKLDSIHIDKINPVSVTREGDSDYVKVILTATVIDYTIDERTGEIVNPDVLGDGKTPEDVRRVLDAGTQGGRGHEVRCDHPEVPELRWAGHGRQLREVRVLRHDDERPGARLGAPAHRAALGRRAAIVAARRPPQAPPIHGGACCMHRLTHENAHVG